MDTAGQEEYNTLRDQYILSGEGFLLVYSITAKSSWFEVTALRKQILRVKATESYPMIIVGNKCDLETDREVSKAEVEAQVNGWGCPFYETSAKNRLNVEESFHQCVREIWKKRGEFEYAKTKKDKNVLKDFKEKVQQFKADHMKQCSIF